MPTRHLKTMIPILTLLCISQVFSQSVVIHNKPLCTLIVRTDNNEIVNVWINRQLIGKTPLEIDTLPSGFYDISFMNPDVRDSILTTPIQNFNDRAYTSYDAAYKNDFLINGNADIKLASAELARESNVKLVLPPNKSTIVVFNIGQAKEYIKSEKRNGNLKIMVGVIIGTALVAALISMQVQSLSRIP